MSESVSKYKDPHPSSVLAASRFESELAEIEDEIREYAVQGGRDWYQHAKGRNRVLYRISGVATIVLGATIPLLSAYPGGSYRLIVAVIGVVISAMTGLNAFFRWERTWQSYSIAQFDIEYLLHLWRLKVARARSSADKNAALEIVRDASDELLEEVRKVKNRETVDYFRDMGTRGKSEPGERTSREDLPHG